MRIALFEGLEALGACGGRFGGHEVGGIARRGRRMSRERENESDARDIIQMGKWCGVVLSCDSQARDVTSGMKYNAKCECEAMRRAVKKANGWTG